MMRNEQSCCSDSICLKMADIEGAYMAEATFLPVNFVETPAVLGLEPVNLNLSGVEAKHSSIDGLQNLVAKYCGAASKASSTQLKSEFENLIREVDHEFDLAGATFNSEMTELQPILAFRLIDVRKATLALENFLAGLDDRMAHVVERLIGAWRNAELKVDERTDVLARMHQFPGLYDLIFAVEQAEAQARPISERIDTLQQNLTYSANHRVKARFAYADALSACGARNKSQELILQAMSIQMGLPVEELRRSKKRRKEQDRSRRRRAKASAIE